MRMWIDSQSGRGRLQGLFPIENTPFFRNLQIFLR